jgi:nucleotide-binding universal stress UspA family protein
MAVLKRIIVGFDGTDRAEDGLVLGRALAAGKAPILLAHCVGSGTPMAPGWRQYENALREDAEKMLSSAAAMAAAEGSYPSLETRVVTSSSPARGLHELAEEERADLVAVGSSHRGRLGRLLVGAVPERLLNGASCAVAVAAREFRERPSPSVHAVAVGVDGSPESRHALNFARKLAADVGATLHVLAVVEPEVIFGYTGAAAAYDRGEFTESQKDFLTKEVAEAVEGSPATLKAKGEVLSGNAAAALASRAEQGIDLLVMGSRGYGPVRKVLLGSVSAQLARDAPCSLLVVPRADHEDA